MCNDQLVGGWVLSKRTWVGGDARTAGHQEMHGTARGPSPLRFSGQQHLPPGSSRWSQLAPSSCWRGALSPISLPQKRCGSCRSSAAPIGFCRRAAPPAGSRGSSRQPTTCTFTRWTTSYYMSKKLLNVYYVTVFEWWAFHGLYILNFHTLYYYHSWHLIYPYEKTEDKINNLTQICNFYVKHWVINTGRSDSKMYALNN